MTTEQSSDLSSSVKEATTTIRDAARGARDALEDGRTSAQWKAAVSEFVRGATHFAWRSVPVGTLPGAQVKQER